MENNINLNRLAQITGWVPLYVDEEYTSYEYVQKIKKIESLCHVLKLYDNLSYENYLSTFDTIISVLPRALVRKIKQLTKRSDADNINSLIDLVCYEVEEYKNRTDYSKLYTYGILVGVDISKNGYEFCYTMPKTTKRNILSFIESKLPIDLAPILGRIKKIDYKIGYIKQNVSRQTQE